MEGKHIFISFILSIFLVLAVHEIGHLIPIIIYAETFEIQMNGLMFSIVHTGASEKELIIISLGAYISILSVILICMKKKTLFSSMFMALLIISLHFDVWLNPHDFEYVPVVYHDILKVTSVFLSIWICFYDWEQVFK